MSEPVGVVLGAGLSSRMGQPKQLLPYGDTTVLGAVVATALESQLSRMVVVVGPGIAFDHAGGEAVDVVVNPNPELGNLSSLRVAASLTGEAPILLLMGDMPGVRVETIDAHLDAWRTEPGWLVTTRYADGVGHPLLLSAELIAGLDELEGPKPLWALTRSERATSLAIDASMPIDIDTPEDYAAALAEDAGSVGDS